MNIKEQELNQISFYEECIATKPSSRGHKSAITFLVVVFMITFTAITFTKNSVPKDSQAPYIGTNLSISTEYDYLDYRPNYISTRFGEWYAEFSFESTERFLAFDNYDNYTYFSYVNDDNTLNTGVFVSETLPEQLNLSDKDKQSIEDTANNNEMYSVTTIIDGIENRSTYKNVYNIGYIGVIQQKQQDNDAEFFNEELAKSIYTSLTFAKSDNIERSLVLDINGFSSRLNLNDLSFINGYGGVFFGQDNILRLYNYKEDKTYGFIAEADNEYILSYSSDMEPVEGTYNLYYNKYIDDNTMNGYRMFGVQTPNGFYTFKASEDCPDTFEDEILTLLDFESLSNEYINGSVSNKIKKQGEQNEQ